MKLRTEKHTSAPYDMRWSCLDDDTYDGAPDAGPQCVGWGPTEAEAQADFIRLRNEMLDDIEQQLQEEYERLGMHHDRR